jgi:hypothetical protein
VVPRAALHMIVSSVEGTLGSAFVEPAGDTAFRPPPQDRRLPSWVSWGPGPQRIEDRMGVDAERLAHLDEFHHVEPALATLVLRNE